MRFKFGAGARVIPSRSIILSGPIFLDQLVCSESDSNLLECSRGDTLVGLTSCDHRQDVWIECRGMYSV